MTISELRAALLVFQDDWGDLEVRAWPGSGDKEFRVSPWYGDDEGNDNPDFGAAGHGIFLV